SARSAAVSKEFVMLNHLVEFLWGMLWRHKNFTTHTPTLPAIQIPRDSISPTESLSGNSPAPSASPRAQSPTREGVTLLKTHTGRAENVQLAQPLAANFLRRDTARPNIVRAVHAPVSQAY